MIFLRDVLCQLELSAKVYADWLTAEPVSQTCFASLLPRPAIKIGNNLRVGRLD